MKRVLLIQTGGTIAMNIQDGQPRLDGSNGSSAIQKELPELANIAAVDVISPFMADSSDLDARHWKQLIKTIAAHYEQYDGVVILHGTDTMAYTASALSFGLQGLAKPVILTGSQVPLASVRSDARRNVVNAIEIATMPLPEVAICFNDFVYRGNRSTKMSIGDFDAFASPNFAPLAEIGLSIKMAASNQHSQQPFSARPTFSDRVFLLKLYPGLQPKFLEQIHLSSIDALIIEAFGSGNFSQTGPNSLLPFFERCARNDVQIVVTSQAPYDAVDLSKYESGRAALALGAVGAADMTAEATLTKVMYLLAQQMRGASLKKALTTPLAGELSP